jgi:hypothetical protein
MTTRSTLLAIPAPALSGEEARSLPSNQSDLLPARTKSFFSTILQESGDSLPAPKGALQVTDDEPAEPPASPAAHTNDYNFPMSSTLKAVLTLFPATSDAASDYKLPVGPTTKSTSDPATAPVAANFPASATTTLGVIPSDVAEATDNRPSVSQTTKPMVSPAAKAIDSSVATSSTLKTVSTASAWVSADAEAPYTAPSISQPIKPTVNPERKPDDIRFAASVALKPFLRSRFNALDASEIPDEQARVASATTPIASPSDKSKNTPVTPGTASNLFPVSSELPQTAHHKACIGTATKPTTKISLRPSDIAQVLNNNTPIRQTTKSAAISPTTDSSVKISNILNETSFPKSGALKAVLVQSRKSTSAEVVNVKGGEVSEGKTVAASRKNPDGNAVKTTESAPTPPVDVPPVAVADDSPKPSLIPVATDNTSPIVQWMAGKAFEESATSAVLSAVTAKHSDGGRVNTIAPAFSGANTLPAAASQSQTAAPPFEKTTPVRPADIDAAPERHVPAPFAPPPSAIKPEVGSPAPKTPVPHPAASIIAKKEPTPQAAEPAQPSQPAVVVPVTTAPPVAFIAKTDTDGTAGAFTSQRMKSGPEKNQIAEPAAQKVPTTPARQVISAKTASDLAASGSDSDRSRQKQDTIDPTAVTGAPIKSTEESGGVSKGTGAGQSLDTAAIQAERLGHLVNQQVVMVRQSGANNLAVSLKLDPQTELNLQLTNHNGQIEASVSWERGSVAGLENHWKDLQDSLARQNVQLLPLENKNSSRPPASNSSSDNLPNSTFNQSSQNPQRQAREPQRDFAPVAPLETVPVTNKAKTRSVSPQGWESWA